METYFIADLHFGHAKSLEFDGRPFSSVEENDEEIIRRWNSVVGDDDTVWILGDLSWHGPKTTAKILDSLNGTKKLIVGNHDKRTVRNTDCASRFEEIVDYKELRICKGKRMVLCHYPIPSFNSHFAGWYHLYAHVHMSAEWDMTEEWRRYYERHNCKCNMIIVGCMLPYMDYTPRTFMEIVDGYEKYRQGIEADLRKKQEDQKII